MIVGVRVMNFSLPENSSLKGKRAVVRSAIERASGRFNAAIAEVSSQDEHRLAVIAISVLSTSQGHAARMLDEIDRFLSQADGWIPRAQRTEFVAMGVLPGATMGDDLSWTDFEDDDHESL